MYKVFLKAFVYLLLRFTNCSHFSLLAGYFSLYGCVYRQVPGDRVPGIVLSNEDIVSNKQKSNGAHFCLPSVKWGD